MELSGTAFFSFWHVQNHRHAAAAGESHRLRPVYRSDAFRRCRPLAHSIQCTQIRMSSSVCSSLPLSLCERPRWRVAVKLVQSVWCITQYVFCVGPLLWVAFSICSPVLQRFRLCLYRSIHKNMGLKWRPKRKFPAPPFDLPHFGF